MEILKEGKGKRLGWHTPDEHRQYVMENKSRELIDKRMSIQEAVAKFVNDGDFIAFGGFGHVRVSMIAIYEIIRQGKRDLKAAGKTTVHDLDVLISAGCVTEVEPSYAFGHELRGLSPGSRRMVESGKCRVVAEISNAAFQWRWLAASLGVPFIPARNLSGTDTFEYSSSIIVKDPFTGQPITLIPAAYPDCVFIHVDRADMYGNAQIDGITIQDVELSRAARKLIITTEEIISNDEIRREPKRTTIPYFLVDGVVEAPFGSHPGEMPGWYYFDEEHIAEWLAASKDPAATEKYFEKYVFGVKDFEEYLELVGGIRKINQLKRIEKLAEKPEYPWVKKK